MPYDDLLLNTYNQLQALNLNLALEPWDAVRLVHEYRMYWKPENVTRMLLAESHKFTDLRLTDRTHRFDELPGYPTRYVRFVYCLSYGESQRLSEPIDNRKGTPQYWKLFKEFVNGNFRVTNNPNQTDKINQKIELLRTMRDSGIWLLDASIMGVCNANRAEYDEILGCSFEHYCAPIIQDINPAHITVIGKTVYDELSPSLHAFYPAAQTDWIYQPNARFQPDPDHKLF